MTAAFMLVAAVWAFLTPPFGAPDEHAHLNSAIRLAVDQSWPAPGDAQLSDAVLAARDEVAALPADQRSPWNELVAANPGFSGVDQMTQHPPTYYVFGAVVLSAIGFEELSVDQSMLALRIAGLVFALPLPWLVWASVRRLTRSPRAAVVGAAALIAVPQLAHILASVSNDGITIVACSSVAWIAIRVMTGDRSRWTLVTLGVALGLALLTKGTALPFIVFVAIVLLIWPRETPWRRRIVHTLGVLLIAFMVGGWWWARNILLYGSIQPSGMNRAVVEWEAGTGPDASAFLDLMWSRMSSSFWGLFGRLQYGLPEFLTDLLSIGCLIVIVLYFFTRDSRRRQMVVLASLPAVFVVTQFENTWRFYVLTQQPGGLQGRYLFVMIVVLVGMSAVGWQSLLAPRWKRAVSVALVIFFAVVAVLGLLREYSGAYEGDIAYRVTIDGLRGFVASIPSGALVGGLVGFLALVVASGALVLVVRFLRAQAAGGPGRAVAALSSPNEE